MSRSLLLFVLVVPSLAADDDKPMIPAGMLTVQKGELPIIVSAPHGGRKPIPNCPERKGKGIPKFATVNDTNTDELAKKVLAAIEKKMHAKPYGVVAHFERKYADVNRSLADGVESDAAKPYYEAYHAFLKESRAAVQKDWGRGLLIDLHGHGGDAVTIFRGTNDGKTVQHLVDRFGKTAFTGEKSVLGQLAAHGYTISPANTARERENPAFGGGYIVATYGSKADGSVDAIQLELGARVRSRANADTFATDLAAAVAVFAAEYLPAKKAQSEP
ncbi:N-formylglutamate amidohydrolase [Limnoglobus roseus]|uniref:N-formylglutamate amidohydrolase n=1 Tax=Limnoglobus roseus TaxID=2598579 RepID=A0A5C1AQM9_9BACT|nr:N-formylglutamate amidohydrolase [Limnoglobus roseus]QEL20336.1 hypothetical protein PX52LOC_07429 [Limnoglobus roseus]